jgi:hypothetical protein
MASAKQLPDDKNIAMSRNITKGRMPALDPSNMAFGQKGRTLTKFPWSGSFIRGGDRI